MARLTELIGMTDNLDRKEFLKQMLRDLYNEQSNKPDKHMAVGKPEPMVEVMQMLMEVKQMLIDLQSNVPKENTQFYINNDSSKYYTKEEVARMSQRDILANREKIHESMKAW